MSTPRRLAIVAIGFGVVGLSTFLPTPAPFVSEGEIIALTVAAKSCLAVLVMAFLFWMTNVLPFAVTGLLAISMMHLLGVDVFENMLEAGFGHPIACFVIGILLYSLAVTKTGLGRRITLSVLGRVGLSPRRTLFAFLAVGALISTLISDTAVAAMLVPIAVDIARSQKLEPLRSNFGKALLMASCWGPAVGGLATPMGATPNQLALSLLEDVAGIKKTFVDWMVVGVPASVILLPLSWIVLVKVFPPEMSTLSDPGDDSRAQRPLSRQEWITLAAFFVTVGTLLAAPAIESRIGIELSTPYVLLSTSLVFFMPGVDILSWRDVQRDFAWGALLLVMTGMALGSVVHSVGLAQWISHLVLGRIGTVGLFGTILLTVLFISLLHNFLSSNLLTAVIMIPIIIQVALAQGVSPWLAAAPAAFASTFGLIMVTTTPTNLIPYSAGYFSMSDFAKAGIVMTFVGSVVVGCVIYGINLLFGIQ